MLYARQKKMDAFLRSVKNGACHKQTKQNLFGKCMYECKCYERLYRN